MLLSEIGEAWRHMPLFHRRLERAKSVTERALKTYRHPYIALSGGKDSIAMLGIVAEAAKKLGVEDITAWAHLSDASYPGTAETIREACQIAGMPLVEDWSPVSAFDVIGAGSRVRFGKKGYFFSAIKRYAERDGRDMAFVGVRAAESHRRRRAVRVHGDLFDTTVPTRQGICYPLAWFQVQDVAAAIVLYGLPFHPIYSKKPFTGMGAETECIRLGYVTSLDNLDHGGLTFLKVNYPDMYTKLIAAKPELSLY